MNNRDLQDNVIRLLEDGHTVLAETERFVHQVQREFRLRRINEGKSGWEPPRIFTLNRWMDSLWNDLWPERWPASSFVRWKALNDCLQDFPPPEPLLPDTGLIHLLDESFELCLRYGMDPGKGEGANRLIEWKRDIWRSFAIGLEKEGLFHPARLPKEIREAIDRARLPGKMALVGFEFAGHWEKQLLGELRSRTGAVRLALPSGDAPPEALVYRDPEGEITGIMENLLAAAEHHAPHEIALVLLDSDAYSPAVSKLLKDLLGDPLNGDLAAYNLCPDRNLSDQPLFHAAALPARFAMGGEMRQDLFSLLRSPYYGLFSPWNRRLSSWDRTWRSRRIESGIDSLLGAVGGQAGEIFPEAGEEIRSAVAPFQNRSRRPASSWAADLRKSWTALGFPVLANELDQVSWRDLSRILSDFEAAFGKTETTSREFIELLSAAAARTRVQRSGIEDAGIQLLGSLDARGLVFGKIFAPGFVSESFPRSARPLPLLSPTERKSVLGGTMESQFAFARYIYGNLLAAAPDVTLSRPMTGKDGGMCLPSPFWPAEEEKLRPPVIPWKHPLPALQRARWVRQSISGVQEREAGSREAGQQCGESEREKKSAAGETPPFQVFPFALSNAVTVSRLQSLLLCPAQFFFRHILELEELESFEPGIPPLERGQVIHKIVASFVTKAIEAFRKGGAQLESLGQLLRRTAEEEIGARISETVWRVELERLMGQPGYPGLLARWVENEWQRIADAWTWIAVESTFDDLEIKGCAARLKGRLDRIDSHPALGLVCWDYKTGSLPVRKDVVEELSQPQLPAYLLALSKGAVVGVEKGDIGCGAGYIELSSPGKTKHQVVIDPGGEKAFLANWEDHVSAALNAILSGDISPRWLKEDAPCGEKCAYGDLCGGFEKSAGETSGDSRPSAP